METILISEHTHTGMRRAANQDASIAKHLRTDDKMLAAVIDGVGGYAGGERAAAIAKDCIEQYMQTPSGDTLTMLREAVVFANNQIAAERKKNERLGEMCCVLTVLVADAAAQQICFVHIGDTRLYLYRNGILQKLTRDHSFVGIREDAGELSEQEAMAHPHRNQILREVGSAVHRLDDEDFMDYGREIFLPGDLLLLCSDGLTDMLRSEQLTAVLAGTGAPDDKTTALIDLANAAGGFDNITVVLLQYPGTIKAPPAEASNIVVSNQIDNPLPGVVPTVSGKKHWGRTAARYALLLLIMTAAAGWYWITPKKTLKLPSTRSQRVKQVDSFLIDSSHIQTTGRSHHAAIPGPMPDRVDTLHIVSTQSLETLRKFTDSTGRMLLLLPGQNFNPRVAAVSVTPGSAKPGDTVLIGQLRLSGFENGIDITFPVSLKLENLIFENTAHPFRYLFKTTPKQSSILFMNTAKQ